MNFERNKLSSNGGKLLLKPRQEKKHSNRIKMNYYTVTNN